MTQAHEAELLNAEGAREFLQVSRTTLHRLMSQGQVKGSKVGGQWRFRKSDLEVYARRAPTPVGEDAIEASRRALGEVCAVLGEEPVEAIQREAGRGGESFAGEHVVAALAGALLRMVIGAGASDLHIEPRRENSLVRQRIDGLLPEVVTLESASHGALLRRLKTLAQMDAGETNIPQDGRISFNHEGANFDLRLCTLSTLYGEALTIRILARQGLVSGLDALGLRDEQRDVLREWMSRPNGLMLFSGPVGSGKTTLAYSCLQQAIGVGSKVMTVEDPIEFALPGAMQTSVQRKAGLTFPALLRVMLRHDPDVMLVGALHDAETAQPALLAATMGHLVLAVSGQSSALSAVAWLLEAGGEPFIVSSALIGATSQRLARRVCPDCRETSTPDAAFLERVRPLAQAGGFAIPDDARWTKGRGCAKCRGAGYRGRVVLLELVGWSAALHEAALRGAGESELLEIAVQNGMKTLLAEGVRLAAEGETTLDEVLRVVSLAL